MNDTHFPTGPQHPMRLPEQSRWIPRVQDVEENRGSNRVAGRASAVAERVTRGQTNDVARARALFDHAIETVRYARCGSGWGRGDAVHACDARSGNCSDFHAYFIALARASGIPARFAIGAAIPSERNDGGIDGYHCWAECFADGKWVPVDISEAKQDSEPSITNLEVSSSFRDPEGRKQKQFGHGRDAELPGIRRLGAIERAVADLKAKLLNDCLR